MLSLLYGPTLTSVHNYVQIKKYLKFIQRKWPHEWKYTERDRERGSPFFPPGRALKACQGPPSAHWPPGCHCTKGFAHGIPGNALKMQPSRHYSFTLQTRRTEVRESKWLTQDTEQVSSLGFQVQSFFFLMWTIFFEVLNLLQYCFCTLLARVPPKQQICISFLFDFSFSHFPCG